MDVMEKLQDVFREVFDDDTIVLNRNMTASNIESWDSLMHINLIVACETVFNIKFAIVDIANLQSVGDIVDLIKDKVK